MTSFINIADKM